MAVIELEKVKRTYTLEGGAVYALRDVSLAVEKGEYIAIMGPSGSGKSTLMNILGCLDVPTEGSYKLDGTDITRFSDTKFSLKNIVRPGRRVSTRNIYAGIRNEKIGFVFQSFNLLSRTSAIENVELPLFYLRKTKGGALLSRKEMRRRAEIALTSVGLAERMDHKPSQLSGGQQQRVAIARALVTEPAFILADEPTGNLDSEMTYEILKLFRELNEKGKTIILVTHENQVGDEAKRVVTLKDGRVISDRKNSTENPVDNL
jgi:putative ABC transport system ATP-binding protein